MIQGLQPAARLYLLHAALLTFGLAISGLLFNLLINALGYGELRVRLPLVGSLSLLGLANSLPTLLAALSSLPLWWFVGRIGPRAALLLGGVLQAAFLLLVATSAGWQGLLLAALLTGPAAVLYQISAAPLMMEQSTERERDLLFSLNAGLNIGVAGLGNLVGGFVPGWAGALLDTPAQSATAYRAAFALAGAVVLVALVPLLLLRGKATRQQADLLPEPQAPKVPGVGDAVAGHPIFTLLRWSVLRFAVPPLLISCGAALFIPYLNLYFQQRYAVPDAALGAIFAAIGVTTGAATLLAPLLSRRLGRMRSVVLTQSLAVPCLLLLGFSPLLGVAVVVAMLRGALMNMASPLYDAEAMERTPTALRPAVIGLINGAFAAGYTVMPTLSVEIQRRAGFTPIFVITAICYAGAAAATYWLFVRTRSEAS